MKQPLKKCIIRDREGNHIVARISLYRNDIPKVHTKAIIMHLKRRVKYIK